MQETVGDKVGKYFSAVSDRRYPRLAGLAELAKNAV
jgi:hypothetical protein